MSKEIETTDQAFIALDAHAKLLEMGSAPNTAAEIRQAVDVIRDELVQIYTLTRERDEAVAGIVQIARALGMCEGLGDGFVQIATPENMALAITEMLKEKDTLRTDAAQLRKALEQAEATLESIATIPMAKCGDADDWMNWARNRARFIAGEARTALAGEGEVHRPCPVERETEVAEFAAERDKLTAEVDRLRRHGRSFITEIVEEEDEGFSEEHTQRVDAALVFGAGLDENHECLDCEGAGWRWTDGAEHGFDRWLEKCDHIPTPEKAREA